MAGAFPDAEQKLEGIPTDGQKLKNYLGLDVRNLGLGRYETTMQQYAVESLREKFPLVDVTELVNIITYEIVTDELRQRAESIWLYGSFVNPRKEIDTKEARSDLDIFVVVPEWDLPQADAAIPIFASQVPTPDVFQELSESQEWRGRGLQSSRGGWDRPVDEVWESLPADVKETLKNSIERVFYTTEEDMRANRHRIYDTIIGDESQLEFNLEMGRTEDNEITPGVPIWKSNEGILRPE